MKVFNSRYQIEFAELSKLINKKKVRDIRNYNVGKIEEAVKYGRSIKSVRRKLGIGQGKMYALKDKHGNIISNFDDIVKAAEEFYTDLYSTQNSQTTFIRNSGEPDTEAPSITSDEVRRALKDMTRGKAAGEDGITVDLIKDGGDIMLEKLAALYTQCLTTSSVPESWKNANIILIHKKGDVKELKNYRPISLLSVLYKIFTKIISNRIRATFQPTKRTGWLQEGIFYDGSYPCHQSGNREICGVQSTSLHGFHRL